MKLKRSGLNVKCLTCHFQLLEFSVKTKFAMTLFVNKSHRYITRHDNNFLSPNRH
jgi:hypothetical protein